MAEGFDITVKHPDYLQYADAWKTMRATLAGDDAVKAEGETYLPMKSAMKAMADNSKQKHAYEAYRDRAEFPEIVSPTVQGVVGLAFNKPSKIELPSAMEYLRQKATRDGLPLDDLHRRLVMEVMRTGRYGLMPGVDGQGNFYLAGYTAETILNWDDPDGGLGYLTLDESGRKRNPETNKWETDNRIRECFFGASGGYESRDWVKQKDADGKERWLPQEPEGSSIKGKKPLELIPFVFVGSTDLTPSPDDIPMYGLAKLALRAYRLDADYVQSLHMTSEPTPYVTGVSKDKAPKTIGAAAMWVLEAADAKTGFLEFSGPGLEAQREAIQSTLERAVMFGAQIFVDTRRTAESGEAKKIRLGNQQSSLKSAVLAAGAGLERVLRHAAVWGGHDPDEVNVAPNTDFVDHILTPQEIVGLVGGWQSGAYSKQTLFENLQRGEIIDPERTFEDEEDRINDEPAPLGSIDE